jgi:hypothetical protein
MPEEPSGPERFSIDPEHISFDDEGRVVIEDATYAEVVKEALALARDEQRRAVEPQISIPIVDVFCPENRNCRC